MEWKPEVRSWPSDRAVLFVHGVGNARPGHYEDLIRAFCRAVGDPDREQIAIYFLYYDDVNDWFERKTKFTNILARVCDFLKSRFAAESGSEELGAAAAEYGGDVLYPVLLASARETVQRRFLAQVQQIRLDGKTSGVDFFEQRISIVCHSLGCFHTYEALHRMANDPQQRLLPVTDLMRFENVVFMASPVRLIRTVAGALGGVVPGSLATLSPAGLHFPGETMASGKRISSAFRWVSVAGDLDPVGGHLLRKLLDWGYADITEQLPFIDTQTLTGGDDSISSLVKALRRGLRSETGAAGPSLALSNPHSWRGYIEMHAEDLAEWFE